ncbi:unnamed protein product [Lactuca virosa]|uniref:ATP synthase subunit alpha, mitochondrial n=1 Tax=Lactuca virosa TaxID=75947 RepID=A0AAU9MBZ8_9ASTR|nr:unnamed protein product [Lactuca virosa]
MVTIQADEISNIICDCIEQYNREVKIGNTGTILQVGDGIACIHGLDEVMAGELVEFEEGTICIALNVESTNVGVVLMGDGLLIQEGSSVKATRRIAQIPVSEAYLGRVINALAKPIDGLIDIDSVILIGHGQRELIIGDSQTGKTTVATDTILNQQGKNVICIYVAIGQKASSVAQVMTNFQERGAMEYTIVVAETTDSPATLQYLAPYTGAALAEYFMYRERHTSIIYDDHSKQDQAYRQIVGSATQIKAIKQVASKLKLELAQLAESEAFAQFASDLDKVTQNQLARGQHLCELLKQSQSAPFSGSKNRY